ncbi:DUF3164 family protein [Gilliamella apis]|uniref:Sulfate transporter n=1 Tax=Gilliamella apis TaxID=1970738 RepID=A0A242NUI9_9GAMM|nr:DUF3164 family protein [Gilliamella apis]OTQ49320.1 sulfate transporter [Gilliamella apis]
MLEENKYLKDRKGRLVPIQQIDEHDIEMDAFVRKQVSKAKELQAVLRQFKQNAFDDCYAFMGLLAEKYNRKIGGQKGNVTFSTFDGSMQIRIAVQDTLTFGPELQIAKQIIDECLNDWAKDANQNLKTLITDAFEVDKEGELNTGRILSLRRIKIQDKRWEQAMDAISESLRIAVSKTYINFKEKDHIGKYNNISLDIAGV